MAIFLLLGLIGFFIGAWFMRRKSTLTRLCRWRLDRAQGAGHYVCAACGAACDLAVGQEPRDCLRKLMAPEAAPKDQP